MNTPQKIVPGTIKGVQWPPLCAPPTVNTAPPTVNSAPPTVNTAPLTVNTAPPPPAFSIEIATD